MKKIKNILFVVLISLTLTGCGKVAKMENGEDKVVTLTSGGISVNTLYERLKDKYGSAEIIELIDSEIFENKYKDSENEIKEKVDDQIEQLKKTATESNITYSQLLSYYGYSSENAFKSYIKLSYLREKAVNDYLKDTIKDKEIESYYEKEIYGDIKLQHILIKPETEDDMNDTEKKEAENKAKTKAEEIIKQLDEGKDFSELAKKYSDDLTNANKGGDLGWVKIGDMVEEFENASFKLKKGAYTSTPIKTTYGYHIIYKTDEKEKPELKDVKNDIISKLVTEKLNNDSALLYETLEKIRKEAGLKIEDSDLKKAYDTYTANIKAQARNNKN